MMQVEFAGSVIDGVDQNGSHTDHIRRLCDPCQGIPKQGFAQSLAAFASIDRQAGQKDQSDWMVGNALCNSFGCLVLEHGTGHERVIADNLVPPMGHVGLCGFRPLIRPGKTL